MERRSQAAVERLMNQHPEDDWSPDPAWESLVIDLRAQAGVPCER